jgi:hypothetical protein
MHSHTPSEPPRGERPAAEGRLNSSSVNASEARSDARSAGVRGWKPEGARRRQAARCEDTTARPAQAGTPGEGQPSGSRGYSRRARGRITALRQPKRAFCSSWMARRSTWPPCERKLKRLRSGRHPLPPLTDGCLLPHLQRSPGRRRLLRDRSTRRRLPWLWCHQCARANGFISTGIRESGERVMTLVGRQLPAPDHRGPGSQTERSATRHPARRPRSTVRAGASYSACLARLRTEVGNERTISARWVVNSDSSFRRRFMITGVVTPLSLRGR